MPWINNPKKKRRREYNLMTPSSTPEGKSMYHDKQWEITRSNYIHSHPLCELCLIEGRSKAAEEVHHKIPFSTGRTYDEKWNLLTDKDNLMSLCQDCHHKLHNYARKHGSLAYRQLIKIIETTLATKDYLNERCDEVQLLIDVN